MKNNGDSIGIIEAKVRNKSELNLFSGVKCITRLDVSENSLDVELASLVNGVTRNRHLQSLNISKNLPKIKARDVGHVMDAIVQLVQVGANV